MKCYDLDEFKIAQIMFKAHNNLLCHNTQLFEVRERYMHYILFLCLPQYPDFIGIAFVFILWYIFQ